MPSAPTDKPCPFCEIARSPTGELVLDEPEVLAFLDHSPLFLGHVLVVPRQHHRNLFQCPPQTAAAVFAATHRVAIAVRSALDCGGVLVVSNNGVSQSVDHLHVHVVPRTKGDGLRGFLWPRRRYGSDEEARGYARRIAEACRDVTLLDAGGAADG